LFFPDLALARRLEFHEAWSGSEHARTQAQLYPETNAVARPIGRGYIVFGGKKSPLSQVCGWGLSGPVLATDLDMIEAFYSNRELRPRIRVCPFADPSLLHLLGERGYVIRDYMNVYARHVKDRRVEDRRVDSRQVDPRQGEALVGEPPSVPGLSIQVATPDEARLWFEHEGSGGDWTEPDGLAFMTIRCTLKSDTQLFLAWLNGQPVGGGALETHDGVAALMAAGTLPAYRTRGIHTALLRARLAAAAAAGCDLAMVHTRPGAVSQRNVLRAGFQLVYTVNTMLSLS
jgi:GNAT superfamily N-acetyltransferase